MTAFNRGVALLMLLSANARAREHDWPAPPRARDAQERVSLSVTLRAGLVEAPFVTTAFPEVSGFGTVLTGTAAVRFSSTSWLRLRMPISFVRLDFPAGAQEPEAALGNLELGLQHGVKVHPSTPLEFQAGFLVPTAEHGPKPALLNNRALALGSALNGGKDAPLLTPGVTGLRLGVSVEHSPHPFGFRASLDLPLLVRISDASLPEETETHPIGVQPALDLRAAWWLTSWFGASLAGVLITEPLRVQEPTLESERSRRLQVVAEPGLHVRLGQQLALGLDASVPVGGNLGGDAWSIGLHGRFEL